MGHLFLDHFPTYFLQLHCFFPLECLMLRCQKGIGDTSSRTFVIDNLLTRMHDQSHLSKKIGHSIFALVDGWGFSFGT